MSLTSLGFGGHLRYRISWGYHGTAIYANYIQSGSGHEPAPVSWTKMVTSKWAKWHGPIIPVSWTYFTSQQSQHFLWRNMGMLPTNWEYFTNEPTLWFEFLRTFFFQNIGVTGPCFRTKSTGFLPCLAAKELRWSGARWRSWWGSHGTLRRLAPMTRLNMVCLELGFWHQCTTYVIIHIQNTHSNGQKNQKILYFTKYV